LAGVSGGSFYCRCETRARKTGIKLADYGRAGDSCRTAVRADDPALRCTIGVNIIEREGLAASLNEECCGIIEPAAGADGHIDRAGARSACEAASSKTQARLIHSFGAQIDTDGPGIRRIAQVGSTNVYRKIFI